MNIFRRFLFPISSFWVFVATLVLSIGLYLFLNFSPFLSAGEQAPSPQSVESPVEREQLLQLETSFNTYRLRTQYFCTLHQKKFPNINRWTDHNEGIVATSCDSSFQIIAYPELQFRFFSGKLKKYLPSHQSVLEPLEILHKIFQFDTSGISSVQKVKSQHSQFAQSPLAEKMYLQQKDYSIELQTEENRHLFYLQISVNATPGVYGPLGLWRCHLFQLKMNEPTSTAPQQLIDSFLKHYRVEPKKTNQLSQDTIP